MGCGVEVWDGEKVSLSLRPAAQSLQTPPTPFSSNVPAIFRPVNQIRPGQPRASRGEPTRCPTGLHKPQSRPPPGSPMRRPMILRAADGLGPGRTSVVGMTPMFTRRPHNTTDRPAGQRGNILKAALVLYRDLAWRPLRGCVPTHFNRPAIKFGTNPRLQSATGMRPSAMSPHLRN
jgi:hypothetical protein